MALAWFTRASQVASVVKNLPANAGDMGLIPGWGRSNGKGIGYPLQYSWSFLVAQLVKNQPAMGSIPGLGRYPGERKGSILAWRIPWTV